MTSNDQWNSSGAVVWLQPGGPGYAWKLTAADSGMSAPGGGDQSIESRFARGEDSGPGQFVYIGAAVTGNPDRIEFNVMHRLQECRFIQSMKDKRCPATIMALQSCGNRTSLLDYTYALLYTDSHATTPVGYTEDLVSGVEQNQTDIMEEVGWSAAQEVRLVKVRHDDISGTVSDFAINKMFAAGRDLCAGRCGPAEDAEDGFWAVTDKDSTPGYLSQPTPRFLWTTDSGATWSASDINVFPDGDATDVVRYGGYVLVASPDHGVAYARFEDIKTGAEGVWAQASGFSASPYPRALAVVGGEIWAVGNSGYIWKSTDGTSFSVVSDGSVTSSQLNAVVASGCNLLWAAGNSGALVKISKGVPSLVTVEDANSATVTANLNTVAVPPLRGLEVFVGAADGNIYASRDEGDTWRTLAFDRAGNGAVDDIQFVNPQGVVMFVIQTENSKSRVLRDLSGGGGGLTTVEVLGTYTNPGNAGINTLAPANLNFALTGGEIDGGYGFIGKVTS